MSPTLPTQPNPVKPTCPSGKPSSQAHLKTFTNRWIWGTSGPDYNKDQRTIWLIFGGTALLLWLTGFDITLAHLTYMPELSHTGRRIATLMRLYGTLPGTVLTVLSLCALFWPGLWRTRPMLYRTALVVALTAVLGVGLINQVMVKKISDRHRPNEIVLAAATQPTTYNDGFRGNSMPSGHAAMGFLLAAPFFPLRRSNPKTAVTFLGLGLVAGNIIGLSRMMLGAHFATDVLISGAIALSAASAFTGLACRFRRIPAITIAVLMLIFALSVTLGNRFNHLYLTRVLPQPFKSINLPCPVMASPTPGTTVPTLTVHVSGYGAPLSSLKLLDNQGAITLQTSHGLYHHLACTATLALPAE